MPSCIQRCAAICPGQMVTRPLEPMALSRVQSPLLDCCRADHQINAHAWSDIVQRALESSKTCRTKSEASHQTIRAGPTSPCILHLHTILLGWPLDSEKLVRRRPTPRSYACVASPSRLGLAIELVANGSMTMIGQVRCLFSFPSQFHIPPLFSSANTKVPHTFVQMC